MELIHLRGHFLFAENRDKMALVTEEEKFSSLTERRRGQLLEEAVCKREDHRVACLLKLGTNPNQTSGKHHLTLLCVAALNRDVNIASMLLDKGANPHFRHPRREDKVSDPTDRMPLCIASRMGDVDMARLLVHHGADVNIRDFRGDTPLYHAVRAKDPDMVGALLDMGAAVDVKNAYGRSPMEEAQDWCPEVVGLLDGSSRSATSSVDASEADSDSCFFSESEVTTNNDAEDIEVCKRLQEAVRQHLPPLVALHTADAAQLCHWLSEESSFEEDAKAETGTPEASPTDAQAKPGTPEASPTDAQAKPGTQEVSPTDDQCVRKEPCSAPSSVELNSLPGVLTPESCSADAFADQFMSFL